MTSNVSYLPRAIGSDAVVHALDRAIVRHEAAVAPLVRMLQELLRSDAVDRDCVVEPYDGGRPLTFDDFENAVITIDLSTSALTVARVQAVAS